MPAPSNASPYPEQLSDITSPDDYIGKEHLLSIAHASMPGTSAYATRHLVGLAWNHYAETEPFVYDYGSRGPAHKIPVPPAYPSLEVTERAILGWHPYIPDTGSRMDPRLKELNQRAIRVGSIIRAATELEPVAKLKKDLLLVTAGKILVMQI